MEYSAESGNKLALTAVTPSPTKEVEVMWTIQNFKMLVHCAVVKRPRIPIVPNEDTSQISPSFIVTDYTFPIEVMINERADTFKVQLWTSDKLENVGIEFCLVDSSSPVWMAKFAATIVLNNKEIKPVGSTTPCDFKQSQGLGFGCSNFFQMQDVDNYLNEQGMLKIKIKITHLICSSSVSREPSTLFSNLKLNNDFRVLFQDNEFTDIEVKVSLGEEKTFKCHKIFVSARSPVFRAIFQSDTLESRTGVIEIPDISAEVMEQFLCFIYSGGFTTDLPSLWVPLLPQLAEVANKYCVMDLVEFCDKQLIRSVTTENAVELIVLVKRLRLKQATKDLESFIARNLKEVF